MSRKERQAEEKKNKKGIAVWFYRILIFALLGVMAFSGYNLYKIYSEYHEGTVIYNDLADEVGAGKGKDTDGRLQIDWIALKDKNADTIAWLRCKDTPLNYPIVQGDNNDYYLYYTYSGEENGKGTIFVDVNVERPFLDFNTIMYGHRMKDGSMFKTISKYFGSEGADFYEEHPTMELYTPEKDYDVYIFAAVTVDATEMEWYRMDFKDDDGVENPELKREYLDRVRSGNERPEADKVDVGINDRIIMMSTCTAQLDHRREVVWGKLVEYKKD